MNIYMNLSIINKGGSTSIQTGAEEMAKKKERLEAVASAAMAAGVTYGQYQQLQYVKEHPVDKNDLRDRQPIYIETTGEYLCPECAHQLKKYKNCGHCGKVIIWKRQYC